MPRTLFSLVVAIAFLLLPALPDYAQVASRPVQPSRVQVHQEPCWQQVGVPQTAIQQRDAIARERRSQVEAACADTSLTPQQKQQKIREIRQQAKERIDSVITPQQQQDIQACQRERAASHPTAPAVRHAAAGPCGELTSPATPHPQGGQGNSDPGNSEEENR
jgi:hypothetical protein